MQIIKITINNNLEIFLFFIKRVIIKKIAKVRYKLTALFWWRIRNPQKNDEETVTDLDGKSIRLIDIFGELKLHFDYLTLTFSL